MNKTETCGTLIVGLETHVNQFQISRLRNKANEKTQTGFAAGKEEPQKILYVFPRILTQSRHKSCQSLEMSDFRDRRNK